MPFGAEIQSGGVRFRLWAPAQRSVRLVLEAAGGDRALPMRQSDGGWFECVTDAAHAGSRYRFELGEEQRVPDPASRFQPDDVHGASEVIDPRRFDWHTEWHGRPWREAVLYEAHLGAWTQGGDYDAARARLDHLADLGVTALELMPLSDFEGRRNWGYDGVQPFAPDASYGTANALKQLIDAAHARGLMVVLDVVYNHFGPSGNYLASYAPQFFTDRYATPWGQAIDFSQPVVRDFFVHNALYWLEEYRFDGLRFDAVDQIRDEGALPDPVDKTIDAAPGREVHPGNLGSPKPAKMHILAEIATAVRQRFPDRHIHLVLENDNNASRYLACDQARPRLYTAQWNDDFHHAAHVLATGEASGYYIDYQEQPAAALARALAQGFVYQGEYSTYRDRARGEPSAALSPLAFVDFLQNHDQIGNRALGERLAQLADSRAVDALTAIALLAPTIPLLFMGEEWGSTRPFLFFCDYHGDLATAVREGRRHEFGRFAAFADPEARASIPDPNAESTFAATKLDWAALESAAGRCRLGWIRELLAIRRREITPLLDGPLHGGHVELGGDRAFRVDWTLAGGAQLCLAANPAATPTGGLDWALPGKQLYASSAGLQAGRVCALPAWSVVFSLA
jgi:1,4-alpha-glucan branching enzyme